MTIMPIYGMDDSQAMLSESLLFLALGPVFLQAGLILTQVLAR